MLDHGRTASIMKTLRKKYILTPRDAIFASHLDRLLQRDESGSRLAEAVRFGATGETRGIMVVDGPGGGKSTLVAHALGSHPALKDGPHGRPAYLDVSVPSPATFKSMGLEMLRRSGYVDVSHRKEAWSIWETLRARLKLLGIVVLWIDEAHDLFCKDRDMILRALKSMMQGDDAVIVILSGTERLSNIIRSDPQVQRRFSTINLAPVSEATDGDELFGLISDYCARAGLGLDLGDELEGRLCHGARYRFGRCIEIILTSIERALWAGSEVLTDQHFAEAWSMQEGCPDGRNIFLTPDWSTLDPDPLDHPVDLSRPKHRRR